MALSVVPAPAFIDPALGCGRYPARTATSSRDSASPGLRVERRQTRLFPRMQH